MANSWQMVPGGTRKIDIIKGTNQTVNKKYLILKPEAHCKLSPLHPILTEFEEI